MVFENAQDREESWYLYDADGERIKQVSYEPNEKVQNCGTVTILKEDHTIANMLRHQLLEDERVRFAAYQMPHPLQHRCLVRVETSDSSHTPLMAIDRAFDALITEFNQIDQRFKDEVEKKKSDRGDVFE
mmetsp:Transcript_27598/g.61635  ORF Transcript_27598/g.61635 Transcript_27598/m.61635 type:complete len:130 (+) Transcript_27598:128-517(+)|eukprot:CAMPEP_0172614184 /NCGR_PEP_ID=MMETSP1068-20121228/49252_1 /TAXON_ID=35684 /ORGANISM="Pseudopedinella elastica, Strain CCMP716" /LENGTH=129 /DNA_ID=CAMNT_0013418889 /DNA_START=24 /DNA_END=413 /DNA_ORIENTATION=+